MIDICTADDSADDTDEFIFDEDINYHSRKFRGEAKSNSPNPSDLTTRRWRHDVPTSGEVADLLRDAKGRDPVKAAAAGDKLAQSYHRLVLKESRAFCDGENNVDVIAAGMMGLAEAINRFDFKSNNGFTAYVIPYVRHRMQDERKAINRNGWGGETRLQRAVYGNHDITPAEASERVGRNVSQADIEKARTAIFSMCGEPVEYDTREAGGDDDADDADGDDGKPVFVAVAPPSLVQRIHNRLDRRYGGLADEADRRAAQRLKEIGRQAYALELVKKDRARPCHSESRIDLYSISMPLEPLPCEPQERRFADRSFGKHIPLKKKSPKPPEYFRSVYPTWGDPPKNPLNIGNHDERQRQSTLHIPLPALAA
jgi:hypothetical protein